MSVQDKKVKALNDYRHARLRTENLFGSREEETKKLLHFDGQQLSLRDVTFVPAVFTCFRELIDNALDEMVAFGHGDRLTVTYDPSTMVFSVEDNGRGIPLYQDADLGGIVASIALSTARASRNFEDRGEQGGLNGVGASGVNFCSEWFELRVTRDKKKFYQRWRESDTDDLNKQVHLTDGPVLKNTRSAATGTLVTCKLSQRVFPKMTLPIEFIRSRLWEIATINRAKIKVVFNGEELKPCVKRNQDAVLTTLFADRSQVFSLRMTSDDFQSDFYIYPMFDAGGDETVYSIVNNIPVFSGTEHITTFRNLFYPAVIDALSRQANREELEIRRSDVSPGMLIVNVTRLKNAIFDSQSKTRLTNQNVLTAIKDGFDSEYIKKVVKANPEWIEAILAACRDRTVDRDRKELQKKQKQNSSRRVANAIHANGKDRSKCILFLMEGESARGLMCNARNDMIHGCLPLRGKIMNVKTKKDTEVVANKVLSDIMSMIGLKIGEKVDRRQLNYHQIWLAMDQDTDGGNIFSLLVNFFYHYWPELFDSKYKPVVFKFETPLIILRKGNKRTYYYAFNEHEFSPADYKGWEIIRAKGLGRLTDAIWKDVLTEPLVIPLIDDDDLKEVLDGVFNDERADERKEWLADASYRFRTKDGKKSMEGNKI